MRCSAIKRATISLVSLLFVSAASAGMIDKEGMDEWEVCAMCHSLDGISRMSWMEMDGHKTDVDKRASVGR